jgi:thioredoxin reductase (NADPH)
MKYNFDCVVIGCGIAGMTAAIYLKRANVNVIIIDESAPGGKLNNISNIENYPGFKKITGPDLAFNIYEQVKNLDIEILFL